jgi:hypothetical protein
VKKWWHSLGEIRGMGRAPLLLLVAALLVLGPLFSTPSFLFHLLWHSEGWGWPGSWLAVQSPQGLFAAPHCLLGSCEVPGILGC